MRIVLLNSKRSFSFGTSLQSCSACSRVSSGPNFSRKFSKLISGFSVFGISKIELSSSSNVMMSKGVELRDETSSGLDRDWAGSFAGGMILAKMGPSMVCGIVKYPDPILKQVEMKSRFLLFTTHRVRGRLLQYGSEKTNRNETQK